MLIYFNREWGGGGAIHEINHKTAYFKNSLVKCLVMALVTLNKQLLVNNYEVFVICRSINVEVKVINRAKGKADNSYRDIDNLACHKNQI